MYEQTFVNGVNCGLQKYYYINGQLDWKYYTKDGECNSIAKKNGLIIGDYILFVNIKIIPIMVLKYFLDIKNNNAN